MKASWKLGLVAIMTMSLALVLILGATISSAAAPDPTLADDLVFMGNGKGTAADGNNIKVLDIDAMAVVNTIGAGGLMNNNHGVLVDGNSIWTANAALATGKARIVKLDLGTMAQSSFDAASADVYAMNSGLCGIEFAPDGNIWATSMSSIATNGGIYEFNKTTGSTGGYVDPSAGADNAATCGINWNSGGTIAYASLMGAKKYNTLSWPGGAITSELPVANTGMLHISDVAKTANYAYVAAGNITGDGKIAVIDLATNTQVNVVTLIAGGDVHGPTVAHNEGFLYAHSRGGSAGVNPSFPGTTFIFDIGGGSAGGTKTAPVLIGQISDSGTPAVSCGTDVVTKSDFCAQPALSLSKTNTYWASYADYTAGQLSVDYSIGNGAGTTNAYNVTIAGTVNTNGVTMASATAGGNIAGGSSGAVTVKYNVPTGTASFQSTVYATANDLCNNSYAYPGTYPGA
ncbi:MAG: NHL repeat-containing protein [Thermoleophilia bacterium]